MVETMESHVCHCSECRRTYKRWHLSKRRIKFVFGRCADCAARAWHRELRAIHNLPRGTLH